MRKTMIASAAGLVVFGAITQEAGAADAVPKWAPENRVVEVQLDRIGEILGVRYQASEDFISVTSRIATSAVKGLAFQPRDLGLSVYFVEKDDQTYIGVHRPPQWCYAIFKPIDAITGPIVVDLDMDDGVVEVTYPDGQTVRIYDGGESVDWGAGPELLHFDFRKERSSDVNYKGHRQFTLFEFIDPATDEIVSLNVVAEDLLE